MTTQQQISMQPPFIKTTVDLAKAQAAMRALIEEHFVAGEEGFSEAERDLYHARHWSALRDGLGIVDVFCSGCGAWYAPDAPHRCFGESDIVGENDATDPF